MRDKIVDKCGTRGYWLDWSNDIKRIAEVHITHIESILNAKDSEARGAFDAFLQEIRNNLNGAISEDEVMRN